MTNSDLGRDSFEGTSFASRPGVIPPGQTSKTGRTDAISPGSRPNPRDPGHTFLAVVENDELRLLAPIEFSETATEKRLAESLDRPYWEATDEQ